MSSSPPSAYSYKFVGTFCCAQIDSRKARKRELATFDESRREVGMLNPMRDKTEGACRGGEGTTPETTACPEAGKVKVRRSVQRIVCAARPCGGDDHLFRMLYTTYVYTPP